MSPTRKVVRTVASLVVFALMGACTFVVGTGPYTEGCTGDKKKCQNPLVLGQEICVSKTDWAYGCGKPDICIACTANKAATYACKPDGACSVGTCFQGYGDCDREFANGCEVLHSTDAKNCGTCGNDCTIAANGKANVTAARCGGARCVVASCTGGFNDCDDSLSNGCESGPGTWSDSHCGMCGRKCAVGTACNKDTGVCGAI